MIELTDKTKAYIKKPTAYIKQNAAKFEREEIDEFYDLLETLEIMSKDI